MKKTRFLDERRPAWERFEALLLRTEGLGAPRLSENEVSEYSEIFRAICYDLATVRSRGWDSGLEGYLNELVVRGHGAFYRSPPHRPGQVLRFFTETFPLLLRKNGAFFWVALVLFALPFGSSWITVQRNPSLAARVLPSSTLAEFEEMYSPEKSPDEARMEAAATGFYVRNNTSIAFRCFALGILFGLGTAYLLVYNGMVLGTISGYVLTTGHGESFLSFVVSHSSFELTAIVISGAAGLILGHALVAPGPVTRRQAIRERGIVAVQLALGAAGMLAVAALIEGFWSPSSVPPTAKYVAGGLLWALVAFYFAFAGRPRRRAGGVGA